MVLDIVKKYASEFEVCEIIEPEKIMSCNRTTFSYTKKPSGLCLASDKKYFKQAMDNPNISAVITFPRAVIGKERFGKSLIIAKHAADLFYFIHNQGADHVFKYNGDDFRSHIDGSSQIDPTAVISKKVRIGRNVVVSAGCVLRDYCVIGDHTILHPNVIVGADGMFAKYILGKKHYIKHYGGVEIGRNCVLHASSVIMRSANYSEFTQIDDDVQIGIRTSVGHDCHIGEGSDISSGVTVSGRVVVGQRCWVGAGAIISNALKIGDEASVRIGAVVVQHVAPHGDVSGNFAIGHEDNIRRSLKNKTV